MDEELINELLYRLRRDLEWMEGSTYANEYAGSHQRGKLGNLRQHLKELEEHLFGDPTTESGL